ncbi:TPA: DUF2513 domain-containing protein [Yersinia enterocolitica]|nr:DUF2513 domain-containing protein [Yersinia enterocolitica]
MKINHEYLRNLLEAFESSEKPETNIEELELKGFKCDEDFVFHMRLLDDQGLIRRTDGGQGFGIVYSKSDDGGYDWVLLPLRLTSRGHDFIADLRQKEVWQTIKTGFKDEGLSTLMSVTKSLAEGFAKKKIKDLTGIDVS